MDWNLGNCVAMLKGSRGRLWARGGGAPKARSSCCHSTRCSLPLPSASYRKNACLSLCRQLSPLRSSSATDASRTCTMPG